MAVLLVRRALTQTKVQCPGRFKSWCTKNHDGERNRVKHAAQESVYKEYDLTRCRKTVHYCPKPRQVCPKQPPCPTKKTAVVKPRLTLGRIVGKTIWICLKGALAASVVYITIDANLWKGADETNDLFKRIYKHLLILLSQKDSRVPTYAEFRYEMQQTWNKAVSIIFKRMAKPCEDYETYMTKRKSSDT